MTAPNLLHELLDHIAAIQGDTALLSTTELHQWPVEDVAALKKHKLLQKTCPATSVECVKCEEACIKKVYSDPAPSGETQLFIVCDQQNDVNRIEIPANRLEQWKSSGSYFANLTTELLGLRQSPPNHTSNERWEIGLLKGKKHSSHITLEKGNTLQLSLAGHSIVLSDVLTLEGGNFTIDKKILIRFVDNPLSGGGDAESAEQRRERIKKRIDELKTQGVKAFLKTVAEEEGISTSRIKQLIQDNKPPLKKETPYW